MNCTTKDSNPQASDSENRLAHDPVTEKSSGESSNPRVQSKLQSEILEQAALAFGQHSGDLFLLMSQSSWADQGQIWLIAKDFSHNDTKSTPTDSTAPTTVHFHYLPAAQKDLAQAKSRLLSLEEINSLWPELVSARNLSDYDPKIFDGMQYEFVQIRWELGKTQILHRLFMNNPEPQKSQSHYRLIEILRSLLPHS
jgi:hypothetical protein